MAITKRIPDQANVRLTRDEERELIRLWKEERDFEARERLIVAHEDTCVSMAFDVGKEQGASKRFLEDLKQEAREAATIAVENFDLKSDNGFNAFVRKPIQSALRKYVNDMKGPTRIGTNFHDKTVIFKWRGVRNEFERANGREMRPSDYPEIAKMLGVPESAVVRMMPRIANLDISLDPGFTHGDVDDEVEDHGIAKFLHSSEPSPEQAAMDAIDPDRIREILDRAIDSLPPKEKLVIELRILAPVKTSLQKIAKQLRVSKKYVREIEENAITMLLQFMKDEDFSFSDAYGD